MANPTSPATSPWDSNFREICPKRLSPSGSKQGTSISHSPTQTSSIGQGTRRHPSNRQPRPDLKVHPLSPKSPETHFQPYGPFAPFVIVYIIAVVATIIILPDHHRAGTVDYCGDDTAVSTLETRFRIDITAAEGLPFSRVKLIDLSWDIGVGQGGRLLHGWILYHVAARTMTWILEVSAIPYSILFDLLLYVDSPSALWSLLGLLGKSRRARIGVLVKSLCLALAVAQVLFFATIWSAATGYQSTGAITYAMPDQSWVTKDSDNLRICWVLDSQRPELAGVIDGAILGSKYGTLFPSFAATFPGESLDYPTFPEDYQNIQTYLHSKQAVQKVLDEVLASNQSQHTNSYTLVWNETAGTKDRPDIGLPVSYSTFENTKRDAALVNGSLPTTIKGWQIPGVNQIVSTPLENMFSSTPEGSLYLSYESQQLIRSEFELNHSISYVPGVVPYNSTLWYRGVGISLPAPFLGFKNCTWLQFNEHPSRPPDCLCYKGEPISKDFRVDSHKSCTNGGEYVWGFSHFITRIGLVLELVWSLICVYLWMFSITHSPMSQYDRSAVGTLRNALDIAEVVKEELGDNICFYTNKQLMKALSESPPAGYGTRERSDGTTHLGLVPVQDGGVVRRRIQLDPKKLYG